VYILIVEDDERIAGFMKRGLEAEEHLVDIASGKAQTLALTKAGTYDVIILDIFLGPDDGLDICRTLRSHQVQSIILIMTAKGTEEIEVSSKSAGANAYLAKPFAFDHLVDTIARLHKATAPAARVRTDHPLSPDVSEHQADAFTKSDNVRPTSRPISDVNAGNPFSTDPYGIQKQP
jgi:DNA-binding response OmpR family regulator